MGCWIDSGWRMGTGYSNNVQRSAEGCFSLEVCYVTLIYSFDLGITWPSFQEERWKPESTGMQTTQTKFVISTTASKNTG